MRLVVILSAVVTVMCLVILFILKKRMKSVKSSHEFGKLRVIKYITALFGWAVCFVGLLVLPSSVKFEKTIEPLDCDAYKTEKCVILDYNNTLTKFNSIDIMTQTNDSTKFFILSEISYYGLICNSVIVWSNPPYTKYIEAK